MNAPFHMADAEKRAQRAADARAWFCAKYPAEFEHGYRTGYLGENQPPCDAGGYMIGHHTWPIDRRNAWFAGFNLGNAQRKADHG